MFTKLYLLINWMINYDSRIIYEQTECKCSILSSVFMKLFTNYHSIITFCAYYVLNFMLIDNTASPQLTLNSMTYYSEPETQSKINLSIFILCILKLFMPNIVIILSLYRSLIHLFSLSFTR